MTTVEIEDNWSPNLTDPTFPPSLNFVPRSLTLSGENRTFFEMQHYLPRNPSSLQTLIIKLDSLKNDELQAILDYVPPNLVNLQVYADDIDSGYRPKFDSYLHPKRLPQLSNTSFPSFPFLRSLILSSFQGPTLSLLQSILHSTPSLSHLSFHRSFWVLDVPLPSVSRQVPVKIIFPRQEVLNTLLQFSLLRFVDLGYLPTRNADRYRQLEELVMEN
ncbi:hypothetical protein JCM3765_003859 [Sporobolomyces pararoseus]